MHDYIEGMERRGYGLVRKEGENVWEALQAAAALVVFIAAVFFFIETVS